MCFGLDTISRLTCCCPLPNMQKLQQSISFDRKLKGTAFSGGCKQSAVFCVFCRSIVFYGVRLLQWSRYNLKMDRMWNLKCHLQFSLFKVFRFWMGENSCKDGSNSERSTENWSPASIKGSTCWFHIQSPCYRLKLLSPANLRRLSWRLTKIKMAFHCTKTGSNILIPPAGVVVSKVSGTKLVVVMG